MSAGAIGPRRAAIVAAVLFVVVYDIVALRLGAHTFFGASDASVYNRLGDALAHGRLDLDVSVPRGLLALPDPYDAHANQGFRAAGLHDYSLYDGRIYAYWGIVPALLVYLPAHLLGLTVADGHVVLAFVVLGFLTSVAILLTLVRRHLAVARTPVLAAGIVALGFANLGPFLLSRPLQYEVAIAAGDFFVMLGVLCFLRAADAARPRAAVAAGSLAMGLAVGCRPTLAVAIVVAVPLLWRRRRETFAPLAVPFALVLGGLAAYNYARFGAVAEFGTKWQLSDPQTRDGGYTSLGAVLPNLWNYLAPPPLGRAVFPFLFGNPGETSPIAPPDGYVKDAVVGMLWLAPVALLALGAPRWLRGGAAGLRRPALAIAGGAGAIALPLLAVNGTAVRYEPDVLPLLVLVAVLAWLAVDAARPRRWVTAGGSALVAFGVVVTALISLANNNALRGFHEGVFRALVDATGPLAAAAAGLAGQPVVAMIDGNAAGPPYRYDRLGREGASFTLARDGAELEIAAWRPGLVRLEGGSFAPRTVRVGGGVTRVGIRPTGRGPVRVRRLAARWAR